MIFQVVLYVIVSAWLVTGMPTDSAGPNSTPIAHGNNDEVSFTPENPQTQPESELTEMPDMNDLVEVKEEDIPEGGWVIEMEEPVRPPKEDGEVMETANAIAFRPLFRYRQKQIERRYGQANRRFRRRYYVPRNPYRRTGYWYRPDRYSNYYNPHRYYQYYA